MEDRKWYRRRSFYGLLVVALVALAIPVSYSIAGTGSQVTVPIERNSDDCYTFHGDHKIVGSATFSRDKDGSVTVKWNLTGGTPTGNYWLYLYADSPYCQYLGFFGKMKVDSDGHASKTFTTGPLNGWTDFWVYGYNDTTGLYDRSADAHI